MLSVREVTASYGSSRVLDGISFDLHPGRICTVLGVSGCGKSTLLSLIAGLKHPDSGEILLDGNPIRPGDGKAGLILQTYGLFPWFTVEQNAAFGLRLRGVRKKERMRIALEELERVGLAGFRNRYPASLSGGQRQRVAIARTLSVRPDLFLMDEPFSSLDALTREGLQDLLPGLLRNDNRMTILVTHGIEEAVYLGDMVLLMTPRSGKIARMFENPDVRGPSYREDPRFFERCREVRIALEAHVRERDSGDSAPGNSEGGAER